MTYFGARSPFRSFRTVPGRDSEQTVSAIVLAKKDRGASIRYKAACSCASVRAIAVKRKGRQAVAGLLKSRET
jgi:hypothetical protein